VLPPKADNYGNLHAVSGKLLFRRLAPQGAGPGAKSPILYYDLAEREEKTVLDDADGFEATSDGKKLLVGSKRKFAIVEVKPAQKFEKPMRTGEMQARVDPRAEWRQIFADAYRFERDYFYDAGMHGVNWTQVRDHYLRLLDDAVTRWDVNFVLGEFIAELNASHTYHGGGDLEEPARRGVGLLGVDWALDVEAGAYQVKHIVSGGPWDADVRSPLAEPGVNVKEGEYVLAVNGVRLEPDRDPWSAFEGLADMPVTLTVNSRPALAGSRQVVVKTLADETELRFREWIERRRKRVDEATRGKAGYIYVQSTGVDAQNELVRQFMAQWRKDGLVIDERWNSGGQIPDRFIELLNRPMLSYWATRDGASQQWPPVSHVGPKVMLINGWSGSGGDAFPFYFREAKVGPLIGSRTWGGLIGISGAPPLADGGAVTVNGSRRGTASSPISRSRTTRRSSPRAWTRSSSGPSRSCWPGWRSSRRRRSARRRRNGRRRQRRRRQQASSRASALLDRRDSYAEVVRSRRRVDHRDCRRGGWFLDGALRRPPPASCRVPVRRAPPPA